MPEYCFCCDECGWKTVRFYPMRGRKPAPTCPECGTRTRRDWAAEQHRGYGFREYLSVAWGPMKWELKDAYRDPDTGHLVRRRSDGSLKVLAPKGFKVCRKTGRILIQSSAQKKWACKVTGMEPAG